MTDITAEARTRFWSKVRICRETGCWIWTAAVRTWNREPHDGGYGAFRIGPRMVRAHIFAFRLMFGEIPKGKVLLHGCDNRRCVNVLEHIRPGTQLENVREMLARGRHVNQRKKNGTIPQQESKDGCLEFEWSGT